MWIQIRPRLIPGGLHTVLALYSNPTDREEAREVWTFRSVFSVLGERVKNLMVT